MELYVRTMNWLQGKQEGQDMVEYAVLLAFIAIVVWAVVALAGTQVSEVWEAIRASLAALTP